MTGTERFLAAINDGTEWRQWASCRDMDTDIFFPDRPTAGEMGTEMYAVARAVCKNCAVRRECLEDGLRFSSGYGMWGGVTPRARRAIARARREGAAA